MSKHYNDIPKLRQFIETSKRILLLVHYIMTCLTIVAIGLDILDEELALGKVLSDFVGDFLRQPCVHFHLRLDAKLINVNNNLILSVKSKQYEHGSVRLSTVMEAKDSDDEDSGEEEEEDDDEYNELNEKDIQRYGYSMDDVDALLNFNFDDYTNSILENCLHTSKDSKVVLPARAINVVFKVCVLDLLHDLLMLNTHLHEAVRAIIGVKFK